MASRDLVLIMRLRRDREKNKREIDALRKQIETLHKNLNKGVTFGDNFEKGVKKALSSMKKLNTEINKFVNALNKLGGGAAGINKFEKGLVKANENIEKLARKSRAAKKEINGMGKGGEGEMRKLSGVLNTATNDMHTMMTMTVQTQKHSNQLTGSLNTQADQFYRLSNSVRGMSSGLETFVVKTQQTINLLPRLNIQLTSLEKKIREVQAIGKMKKILEFSQDISSIKIFQKELIKLRIDLANVYKEQAKAKQFGVTQEMINEYKRIQTEVQKYKVALAELPALLKKYGAQHKDFIKAAKSIKGAKVGLTSYVKEMELGTYKITGSFDKIIQKTIESRDKIISNFKAISSVFVGDIVAVEKFEKYYRKALEESGGRTQKFEAIVKDLERQMEVSWKQMKNSVMNFARTEVESSLKVKKDFNLIGQVAEKLSGRILELETMYKELVVTTELLGNQYKHTSEAMNLQNQIMVKAVALKKILTGVDRTRVSGIISETNALYGVTAATRAVMGPINSLIGITKNLNQEERALTSATKNLENSEYLLAKKVDIARSKVQYLTDTMIQLHRVITSTDSRTKAGVRTIKLAEHGLSKLASKTNIATAQLNKLDKALGRMRRTGADTTRALERVTAEGFASMIISQAAWMAGFQVIFGTLDKFKRALMSIIDLQEANVRAMRSARSETKSYIQIFNLFSEAMSRARARTGATFQDLGEILYQLGSAGLTAEEALAALDSTLANIIGTEAEARGITKLIAGLYLNFADQIVKVDGRVTAFSEVMKENNEALYESITLTEKFVYINDMLVIAFNYAQVEMDELRDGLKFMAQSGRAANLALDEMVGILAFLNNHLIKAGQAGRAMRVILSKLTKDTKGFSEAFDIEIPTDEPLDFLNIMKQINEKFGEGVLSAGRLGIIFKKLGLRGAEAFNLIQRNIGEVVEYIELLRRDAKGAAEEMQRIRLSDLASQAKIAAANLEALVRLGMNPLMESVGTTVGVFNELAMGINKVDDENSQFMSGTIKWGAIALTALGLGAAYTKLGAAFEWVITLGAKLGSGFLEIGRKQENMISTGQRLSNTTGKIRRSLGGYAEGISFAARNTMDLNKVTGTYIATARKKISVINGMKAAWIGLHIALKAGIIILAAMTAMEIIKYYDQTLDRLKRVQKEYKLTADSTVAYINTLLMLREMIKEDEKITDKNKATIKKLSMETGLLNEKFENEKKQIEEVVWATELLIEKQKELGKVQKEMAISAELDVLAKELENIVWWGEKAITTYEKLKKILAVLFTLSPIKMFIGAVGRLIIAIKDGALGLLKDDSVKLGEEMGKLTNKSRLLENQLERLQELREKTGNKESRDFINFQIASAKEELNITRYKILALQDELETKRKLIVEEAKRKGIISEITKGEERSLDAKKALQRFQEKYYKEILDSKRLIGQIKLI
ncbi:MAG: phage tail tape measure protein, partial [Candidatus Heimdallarchaeaceae archaeon]